VATCILLQPRVKERARVIIKFMAVAKCLRELNNFNTLMSIVSGLNIHVILRLKATWAILKKTRLSNGM